MEIITLIEAIQLTIERHQAVLDGKYSSYVIAKQRMKKDEWVSDCPLCNYDNQERSSCRSCPWHLYENSYCTDNEAHYMDDDKESIKRLEGWLKGEKYFKE